MKTGRIGVAIVGGMMLLGLSGQAPQISNARLAQLAAPVALFPDPVLALTLSAAANPDEVPPADALLRRRSGFSCAALANYIDRQPWDPDIKALLDFPGVADELAGNDAWRRDLGDAYRTQRPAMVGELQHLRQLAFAVGSLQPSFQDAVEPAPDGTIRILPNDWSEISTPLYYPWGMYGDPPIDPLFMLLPRAVLERGRIRTNAYCGLNHTEYAWAVDNWSIDWGHDTVKFPVHTDNEQP